MNKSSFFTTIEDEARLSGLRVQSIFTGVARSIKSIFDKTTLISFDNGFSSQFQTDAIALENYMNLLNNNVSAGEAFNATMRESSIAAQEFANSLNATARSEEEVAAALANFANQQSMSQVSMMAQNHSLSNVRYLLNEYNSGLTTCGLTQQQFIQSVGQSNSALGRYLSNVSSGKASMWGYIGSLVAAKAATIALRIATTALNAVIGMGIGLIVSFITSLISTAIENFKESLKSTAEKLADVNSKLEEVTQTVKSTAQGFQDLKTSVEEIAPRFAQLAQGVDSFGNNVSLTDEEYAEFIKLNNKIAEMFPEINLGLDENGNYMLALSGSADTLQQSLMDLLETERKLAAQKIADKIPDEIDSIKKYEKIQNDGIKKQYGDYLQARKELNDRYTEEGIANAKKLYGDNYAEELIKESNGSMFQVIAQQLWREAGKTQEEWLNMIKNYEVEIDGTKWFDWHAILNDSQFIEIYNNIDSKINTVNQEIAGKWKNLNSMMGSWLQTDDIFGALSDDMQGVVQNIVKNLEFGSEDLDTTEEIQNYIRNKILAPIRDATPEVKQAFVDLFKVNPNDTTFSDYRSNIEQYIAIIAKGLNKTTKEILAQTGYDTILSGYQTMRDKLKNQLNLSDAMVDSLTVSEIESSLDYIKNYGITTWDDLQTFISKKRFIDSFNIEDIEKLKDALDDLKDTYDDVKDIIDDYNDNGYYTIDNLKSLLELEPEYLNTLINEKGQIDLNSQAYKDYVAAKAKTLVIDQVKSLYSTIIEMSLEEAQAYANAEAYDAEADSLADLISATTSYYLVLAKAKDTENNTTAYTDALKQSFGTVANYAAVYDSWLNSLSTSSNEFSTATDEATSALEAQKEALEAEKDALEDEKDALNDAKDALEDYKDSLSDAKDNLQDLIDLTTDYIKQLKEDEKDALEEQKDNFDDIIAKKKEALELAKEEREEADKLADKQNAVVKDKLALAIAQLDDSSAGKKSQKQAADNLASSQKDLSDYLYEQEYNARIAALEAEQEAFDESIDKQIAKIDEYLDNARQLYEDACSMIDNDTGELYGKLWAYTYKYTTQTRAEFDNMWNNAQLALQRYRGENDTLIGVMEHLQQKIYDTDVQIANLDTQISNCETQIGNLDKAISNTSDAISNTSSSIDSVSSSLNGLGNSISDYIDKLNQLANVSGTDNSDITPTYIGRGYDAPSGNYYYKVKFRGRDYYGYVGDSSDTASVRERAYNAIMKEVYKYNSFNDVNPLLFRNAIVNHHAKGTKSSPGGLSIVDEEGLFSEFIPYQIGKGRYSFLPEGNPVFSKAMTNTLFDFASDPAKYANSIINNSTRKNGDTTFSSAPVYHIYGNIDDSTLQRIDKQEKKRYELFKKQFMLEMLRENKNL